MKNFTIENETNNITVHGSAKEADAVQNSERFTSEAALLKLAADWPAARLVEIWNSLPGAPEVKKFNDRATAVARIWKALQSLEQPDINVETEQDDAMRVVVEVPVPEVALPEAAEAAPNTEVPPQTPDVAPETALAETKAPRAKKAPKPATEPGTPREGSKTSQVIAMLKRDGGTTLEEIMTAMGWLKHTTRAMLSAGGSLTKKHGLVITSEKIGDKRVYSIKS